MIGFSKRKPSSLSYGINSSIDNYIIINLKFENILM